MVAAPSVVFAPATATVAVGTTKAVSGVRISDGPTVGDISVTVSDNVGLLRTAAASGVTAVGEGTTSLRLTGSLAAVNNALVSLTYQAASTVGAEWLWVSETNASGVQALGHTVVTTTPAIVATPTATVAPPAVHTPVGVSMVVGTTMQLSGITVTGGQAGGDITVILSDSIGTLSTPPASGVTAQGVGSNALRLTGSIAAINADLVNLTYRAGASVGSDLLWVSATDASGAQSISPVVMNFVVSPAASTSAFVGLSGTTLTGPDTQTVLTAILTTRAGLLTTTNDFGVFATGEGTGTLVLQGTKAAINADLVGLGYRPANGAALPGLADTLNIACYGGVGSPQPTLTLQLIGGHVTL